MLNVWSAVAFKWAEFKILPFCKDLNPLSRGAIRGSLRKSVLTLSQTSPGFDMSAVQIF